MRDLRRLGAGGQDMKLARSPHQFCVHEFIQATVQNGLGVCRFVTRSVILHALLWLKHITPNVAAKAIPSARRVRETYGVLGAGFFDGIDLHPGEIPCAA